MSGELLKAAFNGNLPLVESLLEQGANIEEKDSAGDTPLNEAARGNRLDIVRFLIEKGANVNAPNASGKTALTWAMEKSCAEVVEVLKDALHPERRQPTETWELMGQEKVALVGLYPKMQKRLTYIFDFASRERMIITDDLALKAEAVSPSVSFDDLPKGIVEKALTQFTRLGGAVDPDFALHGVPRIEKKTFNLTK